MMETFRVHKGWLRYGEYGGEGHETVMLDGCPIADEIDYFRYDLVTVRYYISNKEATEDELKEDFLINTLYGKLESDYGASYSEYTGYLWTNDELEVGGHDLLEELKGYDGKYLYMIVELDVETKNKKIAEEKERKYENGLTNVIKSAKETDKALEQLIEDIKEKWDKTQTTSQLFMNWFDKR